MTNQEPSINISVTFRHTDPTPALKSFAFDKIHRIAQKFVSAATEVRIILTIEKRDHIAEVALKSGHFDITARAVEPDLYAAIDKVADSVESQFRKQKEKHVDHKGPQPEVPIEEV